MKKISLQKFSIFYVSCLFCCTIVSCKNSNINQENIQIQKPYFGQDLPSDKLEIFAPDFVSTGLEEGTIAFTPDGKECYWSLLLSGFETILTSRLENDGWTRPEVAPFAGKYFDGWPAIQPDGKRMYFHSARPVNDTTSGITAKYNIWYVDRLNDGWSEPKMVSSPVNSNENSTCPSVTSDGTLYISKRFADDTEKLCCSKYITGEFQELEVLPENVNKLKYNFHGYIAPDESYMIRPSYGGPDNIGAGWNYYISFRNKEGVWSDLINLGKEVNSVYCAGAPSISFDGKYLFFQARIAAKETYSLDRKFSLSEMIDKEIKNPSNGSADIYWIDAKIIEKLKYFE